MITKERERREEQWRGNGESNGGGEKERRTTCTVERGKERGEEKDR